MAQILSIATRQWRYRSHIEAREVVLARPCRDLLRLAMRPAVPVGSSAVRFLQELLVLAIQFVVEDNAPH